MEIVINVPAPLERPRDWRNLGPGRRRRATATSVRFLDDERIVVASLLGKSMYVIAIPSGRILWRLATRHDSESCRTDLMDFDPASGTILTSDCWRGISSYRWDGERVTHRYSFGLEHLGGVTHPHGVRIRGNVAIVTCASSGIVYEGSGLTRMVRGCWEGGVRDAVEVPGLGLLVTVGRGHPEKHEVSAVPGTELVWPGGKFVLIGQVDSLACSGRRVLATNQWTDALEEFVAEGGKLRHVRRLPGFPAPHCVDIRGSRAAVACYGDSTVRVIDLD